MEASEELLTFAELEMALIEPSPELWPDFLLTPTPILGPFAVERRNFTYPECKDSRIPIRRAVER